MLLGTAVIKGVIVSVIPKWINDWVVVIIDDVDEITTIIIRHHLIFL
jgi:hypothetical protein